jgi:hypothetical protein
MLLISWVGFIRHGLFKALTKANLASVARYSHLGISHYCRGWLWLRETHLRFPQRDFCGSSLYS